MIEVSPSAALLLYLLLTLSVVMGFWLYQNYKSITKKIITAPKSLYVCEYCSAVYLDEAHLAVTQCPECHSFNKDNTYSR